MLSDGDFVARALRLAERGLGRTSPNPMVGCVVVSPDGIVVGQGYHERAGGPHAEIHALNAAGPRAKGATLYCNLEPCSHVGRTGPCVERIVAEGVAKVVASIEDPNPKVAGAGFAYLRARGVAVEVGLGRDAAVRLNTAFLAHVTRRRPFVTVKIATSLDGRIAASPGARTALTSSTARRHSQEFRATMDAIGIGSETLLVDDPLLTTRDVWRERPLRRVIFDRRLRTPVRARVLSTLSSGPLSVLTSEAALLDRVEQVSALRRAGVEVEAVGSDLPSALDWLGAKGVMSLLIEGGAQLHRAVCQAGLVDRVQVYVAPVVVGAAGVPWLSQSELPLAGLRDVRVRALGSDTLIEGDVHRAH